ncbi:hypothetical protein [Pontimicrobium sp. SW4]|uniref:SnoaL-like domain-containing protein n=1 Tax=Pontimicrobium sp. SW4 TaxID=3153519 RepID=A0AAU7BU95_9FLAO
MKAKNITTLVLVLLLFIACNTTTKNELPVQEVKLTENEVSPIIDKWLKLWETYDVNMLDEIFLESDELTYFSSEKEGLMKGYKELKPHHIGFGFTEGGKKPEKALWLEDLETRIYNGSAMVGGIWYFGDRSLPKDSISKGPVTFVLIKDENGATKIAHTHFANY